MSYTREQLIQLIKSLLTINGMKQKQYQEKHGYGDEVGCITKEACIIASLTPQMYQLHITLDDCQ